ncbi:hypothetical protein [Teredinibacter franksiae]|uniref:hypothetical protein n=1 Tax=Teredinibacter franksiae TaxID=2761453 RepID=UPI001625F77A|nr:hypothetical protein [Teredinibacter franksiae]
MIERRYVSAILLDTHIQWAAGVLLGLIALFAIIYSLLFAQAENEAKQLTERLSNTRSKVYQNEQVKQQAKSAEIYIPQLSQINEKLRLPIKSSRVLDEVSRITSISKVTVVEEEYSKPKIYSEFKSIDVSLVVSGDYRDIAGLIASFNDASYFSVVERALVYKNDSGPIDAELIVRFLGASEVIE